MPAWKYTNMEDLEFSDNTQLDHLLVLRNPADEEVRLKEKSDNDNDNDNSDDKDAENEEPPPQPAPTRLEGRNLLLLTLGICFCAFLSALDITIVSTSLTSIANDLDAFEESSWIVSSYLATYFSFLIIWAKLSDFLGRKLMLMATVLVFLVFSAACGAAQTATQLIIFRAFQGIGGAGIFSMGPIIIAEMVEPAKYGAYNGYVSLGIAFSFLLGPIFGGAITDGTTWRWVFFINLPTGAIALALIYVSMPAGFPDPAAIQDPSSGGLFKRDFNMRGRLDYPGFVILLAACVLLIVAIEEAGIDYSWSSALVLACLIIAILLFALFLTWQWYLDHTKSKREPIFPWEFVKTRVLMGLYFNAFLSGVPFVAMVIEMPLRFQSINGKDGLNAGVDILPFTLGMGFGSAAAAPIVGKGRVPLLAMLFFATCLQILGTGILYSVPVNSHLPARLYVFQIFAGMGVGLSLTTLLQAVPSVAKPRVLAVAMGGVTQMRILGGALGTSIATDILNSTARSRLASALPAATIAKILKDVAVVKTLSSSDQALVLSAFAEGYHKQLAMMLGFCFAELLAIAMMWEWPLRRLA